LRQANLYKFGAMSRGALPSNHEESQKEARWPFPTVTIVLPRKSCLSISLHGTSEPTHGLLGSTHSNHSQRNRRALLKHSRSRTPRPPTCFGLLTQSQRSKQCLPLQLSVPFHKKLLRILSIFLKAHFLIVKTVRK
jgi:hypothetical protein